MLYLSAFSIGFENNSYTVDEGIGMLEVCVRMFEEASLLVTIGTIGVETVPGSAGIVCRYAYYITVYCMLI